MILHRKNFRALALGIALPLGIAARAQDAAPPSANGTTAGSISAPPLTNAIALPSVSQEETPAAPTPKTKDEWVKALTATPLSDIVDYTLRDPFTRLDSARRLEILRAVLPKTSNENLRRDLMTLATTQASGETGGETSAANAPLLEILDLGANDPAFSVQQQAFAFAGALALQNFGDKNDYVTWRKQINGKSVAEIVRDGAKEFAAQFQAADTEGKWQRFDILLRAAYITGRNTQTVKGVTTHAITASGLEKVRREALQQAGLLDAMALLLHNVKAQDLALKALSFFGAFQPDDAFLQKIEPDVRALLESQIAHDGALPDNAGSLIFRYHSGWVLPLLTQWTQRDYLTPGVDALMSALTEANDIRAAPLLIALAETLGKNDASNLLGFASSLAGVPNNNTHDAAWWRQWWEKNRANYPAEIRDLTLPGLKTGVAALEARITTHSEQYGMDYRSRNQFSDLDAETKYKVMRNVWNRGLTDAVKANMLMTLAEWQNGSSLIATNPRLLDEIYLGLTDGGQQMDEIHFGLADDGQQTQQQAAGLLFRLTLQSFPDVEDYLAWRKRSVGKPINKLIEEGVTAFAARFQKADEAQKIILLQKLQETQFLDGFHTETVGGRQAEVVDAKGVTAVRRQALIAAGMLDAAAALAQSRHAAAVTAAANFLAAFHPGASYLANLEKELRRVYAPLLATSEDVSETPVSLLLMWHGAWVGETLSQLVQRTYLRADGVDTMRILEYSQDPRAIPLLISLLDSVSPNDKQQILRQLAQTTKVPFDAAHDSAWWRQWWQTGRDKLPAEAQAIALLDLKKGADAAAARLTQTNSQGMWETLEMFDALDREAQYAILRDSWQKIKDEQTRISLLERACNDSAAAQGSQAPVAPLDNPHLLDIIALGASDSEEAVRTDALWFASGIAVRKIKDAADFAAWRKSIGDKPLADVIRESVLDLVARMKQADAKTLSSLLDEAINLQWYSFQSGDGGVNSPESKVTAVGLAAVRRKAAFDAGLPGQLAEWLKPTNSPEVAQSALNLVVQFAPGREFMQAIEPDVRRIVTAKLPKKEPYDLFLSNILSYYNSKWATDVLLATAKAQYNANMDEVINLLAGSRDARVVPTLIAALSDLDEQAWQRQSINIALARLTHTTSGVNQSADWWRQWWAKNRAALPEAAQAEPFPHFAAAKMAQEFSIRRLRKQFTIGGDVRRSYWFVASGLLMKRRPAAKSVANPAPDAPPPADFSDIPADSRPGLLVVLADGDPEGLGTRYWQELVGKNFKGKYLAAVVVAPQWKAKQAPLWLTATERGAVKTAPFTTETLAAQVVKDIESKYPVNPAHVFLVGVGAGGQAAYACSLQAKTPFAGFALVGSSFRPSALPGFTFAKGRHYSLLHSPDDKQYPLFLAKAALETLQKAGANAKLTTYPMEPAAAQKAARDTVAAGIKALETK